MKTVTAKQLTGMNHNGWGFKAWKFDGLRVAQVYNREDDVLLARGVKVISGAFRVAGSALYPTCEFSNDLILEVSPKCDGTLDYAESKAGAE